MLSLDKNNQTQKTNTSEETIKDLTLKNSFTF